MYLVVVLVNSNKCRGMYNRAQRLEAPPSSTPPFETTSPSTAAKALVSVARGVRVTQTAHPLGQGTKLGVGNGKNMRLTG